MADRISMGARREVLAAVAERHRSGTRGEKGRILDEYEKKIAAARKDLSHINATMRLFKMDGQSSEYPAVTD